MKLRSVTVWAGTLLLLCVLLRLAMMAVYPPQIFPDSSTYLQAASDLLSGDYSLGQGRRTPGYPIVIALAGQSGMALWWANAVAGVLTSLLLFDIAWRLTGSARASFVVGALHALNLQQLVQEAAVLTETFSAFTVVLSLWLFVMLAGRWAAGRQALVGAVVLGVLASWALMVRPQFIALPLLLTLAPLWIGHRRDGRWLPRARAMVSAAAVAVPCALLVLAWAAHLQQKTGYFTMSTQSGFGMVNHMIDSIEDAPERFAPVRDVLLRTREARIAEAGHARNTIWYAWPEIQRVTGWSLPEASRQLQNMCREMAFDHPVRYARSVASAWVDFWTVPIFWRPQALKPAGLATSLQAVWWVEHKMLRAANVAFVLLMVAALLPKVARRLRWDVRLTVMCLTVLSSSLIQALADQGASSRYSLPTQSLVLLILVVAGHRLLERVPQRKSTDTAFIPGDTASA